MKTINETLKVTLPAEQNSGHTPGPWEVVEHFNSLRIFSGPHYVGQVDNIDDTPEQTVANARLIAAAPDLLAALVGLYDAERGGLPTGYQMQAAAAVIAKAKGE